MHIEHIAVFTPNLEQLRAFYQTYFQADAGPKYTNPKTRFESYFLSFAGGTRLEIMYRPDIPVSLDNPLRQSTGYIHLAISVGSAAAVDALTAQLQRDGYPLLDGPRRTGDGYYESVVQDPDGNRIEITV